MSITEEVKFDKEGRIVRFPLFRKIFLALVIILTAALAFGLGRLSSQGEREPIKVEYDPLPTSSVQKTQKPQTATVINAVFGSKNSDKYHYAHCPGVKRIKEENKVTFDSSAFAEAAGYSLASNCSPR